MGSSGVRQLWNRARNLPRGGVLAVTAGFLLNLSLGIMYTFGNLTTYLTSYLHVQLHQSVDFGETQWVGTVQSVAQGPGVLVGSMCCRRFGPRLTILIGSVLSSAGMALTCLTVQTSFAVTMLTYGLMCGTGIGLAYTSPLLVGYSWFPRHRGVVSGVVVGGYGLGSIIFTLVQTRYLNPENVSPEEDDFFHDPTLLHRVPSLFLVQAAICAGLQLCGVIGVRPPPALQSRQSESGHSCETPVSEDVRAERIDQRLPEKRDAEDEPLEEVEDPKAWWKKLWTIQTLQLLLGFVMDSYGMGTLNGFWKAFGQTFIKDDHFLAMVGVGSSVFNMLGRLVWGVLCDVGGYKPTMVAMTGVLGALLFTFPSMSLAGQVMFLIWVWSLFFSMSGTFSVVVTGTAATFGAEHAMQIYGVMVVTTALSGVPASVIVEVVFNSWGFPAVYLLGGSFVCIGLVATLTFQPHRGVGGRTPPGDEETTAL